MTKRRGYLRNAYFLFRKPGGKSPFGKVMDRREDNEITLKQIEYEDGDWNHFDQNRVQCRVLANTERPCGFHEHGAEFIGLKG